jgi:DNA-binding NtrC family response regulator
MPDAPRVLVVEDNAHLRSCLAVTLEREGFDVVAVAEYQRATELIEQEFFDTLITDLDLPGGTGFDLLLRAREIRPGMRSILMTGYGCSALRKQVKELGLSGYLEKPFETETLLQALQLRKHS